MKKVTVFVSFVCITFWACSASAKVPEFAKGEWKWAHQPPQPTASYSSGEVVAHGANGVTYVAGYYKEDLTLKGNQNVLSLPALDDDPTTHSRNIFIAKYSGQGELLALYPLTSNVDERYTIYDLEVSADGSLYALGAVDHAKESELVVGDTKRKNLWSEELGMRQLFIAKLTASSPSELSANWIHWMRHTPVWGYVYYYPQIEIDRAGTCFFVYSFDGEITLESDPQQSLSTVPGSDYFNIFLVRFEADGSFDWARSYATTNKEFNNGYVHTGCSDLAIDPLGNGVYLGLKVSGEELEWRSYVDDYLFVETIPFSENPEVAQAVLKIGHDGDPIWARHFTYTYHPDLTHTGFPVKLGTDPKTGDVYAAAMSTSSGDPLLNGVLPLELPDPLDPKSGQNSVLLIKFDGEGRYLWHNGLTSAYTYDEFPFPYPHRAFDVGTLASGRVVLGGNLSGKLNVGIGKNQEEINLYWVVLRGEITLLAFNASDGEYSTAFFAQGDANESAKSFDFNHYLNAITVTGRFYHDLAFPPVEPLHQANPLEYNFFLSHFYYGPEIKYP